MTRAAVYARISQDDLHTEKGVGRQIEDARALAEARGWEVVGEYADNDVSAHSTVRLDGNKVRRHQAERAEYRRLMDDAEAGTFDRIVCYQTSRLWRSRRERAEAMEVLEARRISVAAVQGPELDMSTASGRMIAGVLGEFDTAESAIKSERVARAALQRAQEGRANGAVAYGWRREYQVDDNGRRTGFADVEDPAEAVVVREIVARVLAGDPLRAIAVDLNERGVPTPSRRPGTIWRHTTLRKLALRPANIGLRVHRGEVIGDAAWPSIVDEDDHERVVALLRNPGRRRENHINGRRRHLISYGVGECGVCGGVLRVTMKGNPRYGEKHPLYVCDPDGHVGRRVEFVDELVRDVVVARLARPDAAAVFASGDDRRPELARQIDEVRGRLNDAADQYADGAIDAQQMARITERLRPQLDDLEAEYRRGTPAGVEIPPDLMGAHAAEAWDQLDVPHRAAVLEALGLRVVINRQRPGPGFDPAAIDIRWDA